MEILTMERKETLLFKIKKFIKKLFYFNICITSTCICVYQKINSILLFINL